MVKSEQPVLTIEEVHVHYGASHVLQGVTLAVPPGRVTAIVGRNGVGKTTLMHAVMGLVPVTGGRITVAGQNLAGLPAHQRRGLGLALVPQGRRLFRSLTVAEHLHLLGSAGAGNFTEATIFDLFPRLAERRHNLARNLSGGEQSMLSIARALITNPTLLLMDEPTEGLAPLLVALIRNTILKMRAMNLTVLLVEQKLKFALAVADYIAVMERGVIVRIFARDEITDVEALSDLILGKVS